MTELSLPASLDFSKKLPELPDGATSTLMSVQSSNSISFSPSQVIQFDLPSRAGLFIDGKSVFLRYKVSYTSAATAGVIKRKPVYTNFARLDEFVGSVPVNSVYQYNQVANMWVDTNCSLADVYGQQASYGLTQTVAFNDVDGVTLPTVSAANDFYVAAPLVCSWMTGCDKLIPTGLMAPIRVQLTVDTIANIATVAANVTALTITQPELCFCALDLGAGVQQAIASVSPKLYLKSQGWANASQSLASGTSGFNTLVFNHRYASIDNLYFLSTSNDTAKAVNTLFDSFNPLGTAGQNGSFQITIGQATYPQLPINNANGGLASVFQYLRECVGIISDQRNTMCITNPNFNQYANGATASTADSPAKFIIGVPLSRINQTSPYQQMALLSGVSAQSTPINVLLNAGSAFNSAMNFFLIAQYSQLLEIDTMTQQVQVIC
jgi:hypothetical protein